MSNKKHIHHKQAKTVDEFFIERYKSLEKENNCLSNRLKYSQAFGDRMIAGSNKLLDEIETLKELVRLTHPAFEREVADTYRHPGYFLDRMEKDEIPKEMQDKRKKRMGEILKEKKGKDDR